MRGCKAMRCSMRAVSLWDVPVMEIVSMPDIGAIPL
jgi:hypothetical protein